MMLVLLYNIIQLYKIQSSQKYCRGPSFNPPHLFMLQLVMYTTQASILQMRTVLHTYYTLRFPSTELQIYRFRLNLKTYIMLSKNHTCYYKKCGISIKLECKKIRRELKRIKIIR